MIHPHYKIYKNFFEYPDYESWFHDVGHDLIQNKTLILFSLWAATLFHHQITKPYILAQYNPNYNNELLKKDIHIAKQFEELMRQILTTPENQDNDPLLKDWPQKLQKYLKQECESGCVLYSIAQHVPDREQHLNLSPDFYFIQIYTKMMLYIKEIISNVNQTQSSQAHLEQTHEDQILVKLEILRVLFTYQALQSIMQNQNPEPLILETLREIEQWTQNSNHTIYLDPEAINLYNKIVQNLPDLMNEYYTTFEEDTDTKYFRLEDTEELMITQQDYGFLNKEFFRASEVDATNTRGDEFFHGDQGPKDVTPLGDGLLKHPFDNIL